MKGKKVAVLCPGPSLPDYWQYDWDRYFSPVIAVNDAIWKYPCDWVAYFDNHIYRDCPTKDLLRPSLAITGRKNQCWEGVERHTPSRWGEKMHKALAKAYGDQESISLNYTFPGVLCALQDLLPDAEVHIYGMDMALNRDTICGIKGTRTPKRFLRELPYVRELWRPHWQVHSRIDRRLLRWIQGEGRPEDVLEALGIPEYIRNGGHMPQVYHAQTDHITVHTAKR